MITNWPQQRLFGVSKNPSLVTSDAKKKCVLFLLLLNVTEKYDVKL